MFTIVDIRTPIINQIIVKLIVLLHIIVIIKITFRKLYYADYIMEVIQ